MATKAKARLLTHRTVAKLIDIDTETLRIWVAEGEFPRPHSIIKQTWFYPADQIDHFLESGTWPEGTAFRPGDR
jgi:predicted DNA-binding transcriptional regulator AlpA